MGITNKDVLKTVAIDVPNMKTQLDSKVIQRKKVEPLKNIVLTQIKQNVLEIDKNGVIYAQRLENGATSISKSTDNGNTFTIIYDFSIGKPSNLKALDNGEILVAINKNTTTDSKTKIFLSSSNQTVFTQVLELNNMGCECVQQWGMEVCDNIVVVSEYGVHGQATRVYLSKDYGNTFTQILNLLDYTNNPSNTHVHGSFYDKYYERIWVTWGDGGYANEDNQCLFGLFYTDDFGATWIKADIPRQLLNGYALEDRVVLLGDSVPNGVWVYEREGKDKPVKVKFVKLFDEVQRINYVCSGQIFRKDDNSPLIIPVSFANGDTNATGTKFLLATTDGLNYQEIWRDNINHTSTMLFNAYAPTNDNKLIGQYIGDGRFWTTQIKGDFGVSEISNPVDKKVITNIDEIDIRDLGVKGWTYDESPEFLNAIRYCVKNKKTLVIPKEINLRLKPIKIKNLNDINIKFLGDITEINNTSGTLQHLISFINCNNINLTINSNVSRVALFVDSRVISFDTCTNINVTGVLKEIFTTQGTQIGVGVGLDSCNGFNIDLILDGFQVPFRAGQSKCLNGNISGIIKNSYKAPLLLHNLENVNFVNITLKNNANVGNQPNISGVSGSTMTNVLFKNIYFGKGVIGANILMNDITATNVIFEDCDFTEFTGNIGTKIRTNVPNVIKRNNKGLNWLSAMPSAYSYWNIGEIVYNTNPISGGYLGWVCTTSGDNGGTWKAFGLIA